MSDLRVAVVAEGATDAIIIEAALKALLPRPFVLTQLQPEQTSPRLGNGWGGVLRWCDAFAQRGSARLEDDPTLPGFDLFVIHVDADVADATYADCGAEIANAAITRRWPTLPSRLPCPPSAASADAMRACLMAWTKVWTMGPTTVLCVPSKAVEAWLAAALFDNGHELLTGLECNRHLEARLRTLPMAQRIKKAAREYRARAAAVTANWDIVRRRCAQAERFSIEVAAVPIPT